MFIPATLVLFLPAVLSHIEESASPATECSLYIAPSTIPNAGLGIFTTAALEVGDRVGNDDLMIPIVDADLYMGEKFSWMIDDYTWVGTSSGLGRESQRQNGVNGFGPGLDSAINCNLALLNVDRKLPRWDDGGLHRKRNPGAGAITQYSGSVTYANTKIPAGSELFKHYGDDWFKTRPDVFGNIPLSGDFVKANVLLQRFDSLHLREPVKRSLYNLTVTLPFQGRTLNALPRYEDISQAVAQGIRSLHQPAAIRSIRDLDSAGRCLDNIRSGRSIISEAGRGAFASRRLKAGNIITGSPLIHIPYEEMLLMYNADWNVDKNDYDVDSSKIRGRQLLLNYCWGHKQSTVLFCPYGGGINLINHNQSLANVAIQWAPDGQLLHNATWLRQTPLSEMEVEFSTKLAWDYVALRDIEEGEELFLDYGNEWETAWQNHVLGWKNYETNTSFAYYHPASYYNLDLKSPIRTKHELETDPYPANIELRCHTETINFSLDPSRSGINTAPTWQPPDEGCACEAIERVFHIDGFVYAVRFLYHDGQIYTIRGVPRAFFAFFDRPYTTDIHLPWAFRQKMMIPDEMFPITLKNLNDKTLQ